MRAALRLPLSSFATAILLVWAISLTGVTGWSLTVNWTLFIVSLALLAVSRIA